MSEYKVPYQGKQTVVDAGGGFPHGYKQVNTYSGSQRGWMVDTVMPYQVEATKVRHLQRIGKMIADYEIVCTNPDLRVRACTSFLSKVLIHKGNLQ